MPGLGSTIHEHMSAAAGARSISVLPAAALPVCQHCCLSVVIGLCTVPLEDECVVQHDAR